MCVIQHKHIHTHTYTLTHKHINSQWNVERHTRKFQSANEWWGRRGRCDRDTEGVRVDARGKGQKLSIQPAQIIMIITIRWRLGVRVLGLYRRWRGQRGWYRRRRWQRRVSAVVHIQGLVRGGGGEIIRDTLGARLHTASTDATYPTPITTAPSSLTRRTSRVYTTVYTLMKID